MVDRKRKLSNFMLTPKFQLKLTYYYIAVGLTIIAATIASVYFQMIEIQNIMNTSIPTEFSSQSRITEIAFLIAQISMFGFVAFAIASFVFALMISHRIAGPVLAITAVIEELKKGNYDYGRKLRRNDELTQIMDRLHELQGVLKDKQA